MSFNRAWRPVRVGLVADEPIRLAGLVSVFEEPSRNGHPRLVPISGSLEQLLSGPPLDYLIFDLHSSAGGLETLELIRRVQPELALIVIGPAGNDELVMSAIAAGARAFLDLTAGPETLRSALDAVTQGSIWAPRRLLSKMIDRLLHCQDTALNNPYLTARERQVLELILLARSNREIASQLGIEERTVKAHVGRMMRKTGAENRIELSMRALSLSMIPELKPGRQRNGRSSEGIN